MILGFREVEAFEVRHAQLPWPWIAFDPEHTRFAYAMSERSIVTRDGATFESPLALPVEPIETASAPGLHAFSLHPSGELVAFVGFDGGRSTVWVVGRAGVHATVEVQGGRALMFDRSGARLWVVTEREGGGELVMFDARTLESIGRVELPAYPLPAVYELALHPFDDAIIVLASCGQDGTFARVARATSTGVEAVPTSLDNGGEPAGLAGFSRDGDRVFLVEDGALRAHRWGDLAPERTVELGDEVMSNYVGIVVDDVVLVDAQDADDNDDVVLAFDAKTLARLPPPTAVRDAMWVGRLGDRALVTVATKGDPARGAVLRVVP